MCSQIAFRRRGSVNVCFARKPVAAYQVIDAYDNIGESHDLIHEDHRALKIDIDLEAMSASERSHAATVLQRVVDRLSDAKQTADPVDH